MPTPHINAKNGDFAQTVLMPGDPLRAKFIAKNFLENAVLVNDVRGVQGYTGKYKGKDVSVMASGLGMPSMAIYAHELFTQFGVKNIIRTGSAGALSPTLKLRDIVVANYAVTASNIVEPLGYKSETPIPADEELVSLAQSVITSANVVVGRLRSSDLFYADSSILESQKNAGDLAVEMESAILYAVARKLGGHALTVCTISDFALSGEGLPASEREQSFSEMIELALEVAIK
ncbi:MAG: purine-nucleoside phosphorylase [Clostridia bacterium]|nr:purine-nucleoside phosphorylase [Clostridia bacterium]